MSQCTIVPVGNTCGFHLCNVIKFIGVTLLRKTVQVSGVQFYDPWSECCIVCSPFKVSFPSVTLYLTLSSLSTSLNLLSLWPPPTCCVPEFWLDCLLCSFVAFRFTSHVPVTSYGSSLFLFPLARCSPDLPRWLQMAMIHSTSLKPQKTTGAAMIELDLGVWDLQTWSLGNHPREGWKVPFGDEGLLGPWSF